MNKKQNVFRFGYFNEYFRREIHPFGIRKINEKRGMRFLWINRNEKWTEFQFCFIEHYFICWSQLIDLRIIFALENQASISILQSFDSEICDVSGFFHDCFYIRISHWKLMYRSQIDRANDTPSKQSLDRCLRPSWLDSSPFSLFVRVILSPSLSSRSTGNCNQTL